MNSNRAIDNVIVTGDFHIEQNFALQAIGQYLNELEALANGVPYAELGYAERRKAQLPVVLDAQDHHIGSRQTLRDPEMTPRGSIAVMQLSGVMRAADGLSSSGIQTMTEDLRAAYANQNIAGVLIEARTGGGEAAAGTMLDATLRDRNKPVLTFAHLLASAGVMGTLSTEVVASGPMAEIGSIGTMMSFNKKLREWYNENFQDIYAESSQNKNKEFREYLAEGSVRGYLESLNRFNAQFQQSVMQARRLRGSTEEQQHTLSGAMFFAEEAKNRGLIQHIGSFNYAINRLRTLARRQQLQ